MSNESQDTTDWKAVAFELAKRVKFALTQVEGSKAGFLIDNKSGGTRHWRDYMADGLEMVPGVKVDREIMHTMELPMTKRKKAQAKILAERSVIAKAGGAA